MYCLKVFVELFSKDRLFQGCSTIHNGGGSKILEPDWPGVPMSYLADWRDSFQVDGGSNLSLGDLHDFACDPRPSFTSKNLVAFSQKSLKPRAPQPNRPNPRRSLLAARRRIRGACQVTQPRCSHFFHRNCLEGWARRLQTPIGRTADGMGTAMMSK